MKPVENVLRTTLHDLAPEPPDDLGDPEVTYRRAVELRRNRRVSVAVGAVVAAIVVLTGVAAPSTLRRADQVPTATAGDDWRNWPRRGDLHDPEVDRAAVALWDARLRAQGVTRSRPARILYAGERANPVVVLHGVADVGGERLVLVTRGADGRLAIEGDIPAPRQAWTFLPVLVGGPQFSQSTACPAPESREARLVVLGAATIREAQWRSTAMRGSTCPSEPEGRWADVPLAGGAPLLVRAWSDRPVEVRARGGSWTQRTVYQIDDLMPYALRVLPDNNPPIGWDTKADGSTAQDLLFDVPGSRDGLRVSLALAASLPDGTRVLVTWHRREETQELVLYAQDAARELRHYFTARATPPRAAYAAIVDGFDGRWLVVVGQTNLRETTLVDGAVRTAVPLTHGWGAMRLDRDPSADAYVRTGQDPAVPLTARSGERI